MTKKRWLRVADEYANRVYGISAADIICGGDEQELLADWYGGTQNLWAKYVDRVKSGLKIQLDDLRPVTCFIEVKCHCCKQPFVKNSARTDSCKSMSAMGRVSEFLFYCKSVMKRYSL